MLPINKKPTFAKATVGEGGGDRARTGVQTYSSKAFYMLICSLIVGRTQGNNKPTFFLAE
jgi:hypothetical protein